MNILTQHKYVSWPILIIALMYFLGSNLLRHLMYLFMLMHLTSETYQVFQFRGQLENLIYLSKFWILFATLLSFDFTMMMIFGQIPFPTPTNFIRLICLIWVIYQPTIVITAYSHIDPYIKIVSEGYNMMLLYAFALFY